MAQGINKEYIFKTRKYIETYLRILKKYNIEYEITIIAYCVMNNHVHLLVYAEKIEELGKFMHKVNLVYSQFYNKENNRCGIVFRNRYKAEPINNTTYLINCIQYIHMNPVKAKIVKRCADYPFSSYNEFITKGEITQNKIMIDIFGKNCNYKELFDNRQRFIFIDVDKSTQNEIREVMDCAINRFTEINSIKIQDVLSNRLLLIRIIKFLKNEYKFKYNEIMKRFQIAQSTMRNLK